MENSTKFSYILAGMIALVVAVYIWKNIYTPVSDIPAASEKAEASISAQKVSPEISSRPKAEDVQKSVGQAVPSSGPQTYGDNSGRFFFKCPGDWESASNKDYGESADFFECAKIFSGQYGCEDGVAVNCGFEPKEIYETYEVKGKKEAESKLESIKAQDNAQAYSNNLFNGWISMKSGQHTLSLVAFREAENGYYEVRVEAAGSVRTDSYFKGLADSIIASFEEKI